ncbi:TonB-dependent receptor [Flexithrix dorotheae]|uniref:TonB-dependent receptor n=1 Tax=Flexithrix dorotheae TaxID=70993 RepID=UPI0003750D7F|nr:TonB-dependent receptor [Flexithrix dorotheae]
MKKGWMGLLCLILTIISQSLFAQSIFTISGKVTSAGQEELVGATIKVRGTRQGTATNPKGEFSLALTEGDYLLVISSIGYAPIEKQIKLDRNINLNFDLTEKTENLEEVVVEGKKENDNIISGDMSVNQLEIQTIKNIPALLGEVDIVRSLQLLPGVTTVGEGATGFNVRGGGIDQNLVLMDGAPIYNSSHVLGFFSVFNPDAVSNVALLKGGISSQYGGRIASILDVGMHEANKDQFAMSGGIGTVSSRLTMEAPITKGKSSIMLAGRRSYADLFLKLSSDPDMRKNGAFFYDLNGKMDFDINEKNKVSLSGYYGKDSFKFGDDFYNNWGNAASSLKWKHIFNDRLFGEITLAYSDYGYKLGVPDVNTNNFEAKAMIKNYVGNANFSYFINHRNSLNFGINSTLYEVNPGELRPLTETSVFNPLTMDLQKGFEYAGFIEHESELSDKIFLRYGLRISSYDYLGPNTAYEYSGNPGERKDIENEKKFGKSESIQNYYNFEPRFSLRYALNESTSLKFSYNRLAQYIHLLSPTLASTPTDTWTLSTNNIKPQVADQVAVGYFKNLKGKAYELSTEVYYKTLDNQVDFVGGTEFLLNKYYEGDLLFGDGRAYGAEFLFKKNVGRLTGWVSYTLSKSEKKIEGINNGNYYPAKYDRTHNLSSTAIYQLNNRWKFAANFSYLTGVSTTFPDGRFEYQGITVPINTNDSRNNYKITPYHRLDLSATLQGKRNPLRKYQSEWVFAIYNVYSRRNAYSIYFRQNEDNPRNTEAVRLSIFGSMLPSVTYNFKF